jgi:DNA-binding Lrp family transcriptional regulator
METGYVFLNVDPRTKTDCIRAIRDVKGVKEAKLVIGAFDAVAKIEGANIEQLEIIYLNKIDTITGVTNSRLYIVACSRLRK